MFSILAILPGKKKQTASGWFSCNGICCGHRGHKPDTRMRAGVKFDGPHNFTWHCFNCRFTCSFTLGRAITHKTQMLLAWCGIDHEQIQRWSFESQQHKDLLDFTHAPQHKSRIRFKEHTLPNDAVLLDVDDPFHKTYLDYLSNRQINSDDYPLLVTPKGIGRYRNRIIIPYTYKNKIVGQTSRFLDGLQPKYINEQQPGYVFGFDFQKSNWSVCILVEGIFDALSINGCALMHNTISPEQARLLAQLNRQIILVPDRDKTGLELCEQALELGYSVSLPKWETGIKDVNDAVIRYGRLPTLLSILQSATTSRIKIEIIRNKLVKKL